MAARAEAARRKRVLQARIGAGVAGVVVIVGAVSWIIVAPPVAVFDNQTAARRDRPHAGLPKPSRHSARQPTARPGATPIRCPPASRTSAPRRRTCRTAASR